MTEEQFETAYEAGRPIGGTFWRELPEPARAHWRRTIITAVEAEQDRDEARGAALTRHHRLELQQAKADLNTMTLNRDRVHQELVDAAASNQRMAIRLRETENQLDELKEAARDVLKYREPGPALGAWATPSTVIARRAITPPHATLQVTYDEHTGEAVVGTLRGASTPSTDDVTAMWNGPPGCQHATPFGRFCPSCGRTSAP